MSNPNILPPSNIDVLPNDPLVATFVTAYKASKDPRIQALDNISDPALRFQSAMALKGEGLIIDTWIDAYNWNPYFTNRMRMIYEEQGQKLDLPEILVSTDPLDYPRWVPPVVVPPPVNAPASRVGVLEFGTVYGPSQHAVMPEAGVQTNIGEDSRGTFIRVDLPGFGLTTTKVWVKVA